MILRPASGVVASLVLVTTLGLAGCSSNTPEPDAVEEHSGLHTHEPTVDERPSDAPVEWSSTSRASAVAAGVSIMKRFARPSVPAQKWWNDLVEDLTPQARRAYQFVDPTTVPASRVTGPGKLVSLGTAEVAVIHVPTDAGLYAVTIARSRGGETWLADRITPPDRGEH